MARKLDLSGKWDALLRGQNTFCVLRFQVQPECISTPWRPRARTRAVPSSGPAHLALSPASAPLGPPSPGMRALASPLCLPACPLPPFIVQSLYLFVLCWAQAFSSRSYSLAVAHGLSCPEANEAFPSQGLNSHPLLGQADS